MTDKKIKSDSETSVFTSSDLKYILEVNQKAIEIYVEVEKQNDQILKTLEYFKEVSTKVEEDLKSIKDLDSKVEELLIDDNAHDHGVIIDLLKALTEEVQELKKDVSDLKNGESKLKDSTDAITKQLDTEVKSKISEIEKNLFRLVIILGSAGVGTIFTILQTFLHK